MTTDPPKLPCLTRDLPGIGGQVRQYVEDFRVDEVPLYEPSGEGTHVYFRIRKTGVPTPAVIDRIAMYMGVRPTDIGLAGLKDARAVTTQTLSLEHADEAKLAAYHDAQVEVLWTNRHTNKLRPGHLAANRFTIRIREVGEGTPNAINGIGDPEAQLPAARAILDVLVRRGVPNAFGPQRFGAREDTAALGEAMVRGDLDEFIAIFLGKPQPDDPPDCRAARDAFDTGHYDRALKRWPRHYRNERRALSAYKRRRRPGPAFAAIDKRMRRLYASAFQSLLFNKVLAQRIDTIDRVLEGDYARKLDSGGVFLVEDADAEQPRADRFEISPTGPVPGYRCHLAEGEQGEIERQVLAAHSITQDDFRRVGALKLKGARRDLRFALAEPSLSAGADEHGQYIELGFGAHSGCYATLVLAEIMKVR